MARTRLDAVIVICGVVSATPLSQAPVLLDLLTGFMWKLR